MTAFLVGLATMVPFMSLSFYTGPVPSAIGGADMSFWVGLIVAGRPVPAAQPERGAGGHPGSRPDADAFT